MMAEAVTASDTVPGLFSRTRTETASLPLLVMVVELET